MAIQAQPSATAMAPSAPAEQSVTASLTAEIMHDPDDGQPTLLVSTQGNLCDLQEVTPRQLLAKVAQARMQLDRMEDLARQYAAGHVIPAFVEHYNITLREARLDGLGDEAPEFPAHVAGWGALLGTGELVVTVPQGQDPVARLGALRDLVLDLHDQADAA